MSGTAPHAGQALHVVNLLPGWVRAVAVLVYLAVLAAHVLHVRHTSGQRRLWHVGHVAMAVGMIYMFLPVSALPVSIQADRWQALYGIGFALLAGWLIWQTLNRGGASGLWLLFAMDLLAMVYMWSPGATRGSFSWLLVAYLTAEALVWVSGRIVDVDRNVLPRGGYSVSIVVAGVGAGVGAGAGAAPRPVPSAGSATTTATTATATATLACERDLRVSLSAMTVGMAYMILAMLVMR